MRGWGAWSHTLWPRACRLHPDPDKAASLLTQVPGLQSHSTGRTAWLPQEAGLCQPVSAWSSPSVASASHSCQLPALPPQGAIGSIRK